MPSFKYIGDVPKVQFRGITFPQGESVAVPDDVATQLALNPCFEQVKVGQDSGAADDPNAGSESDLKAGDETETAKATKTTRGKAKAS